MLWKGETALPAPILLPDAIDLMIPSRDRGRKIPCRMMYPASRKTAEERKKCKGVVVHFHGGGWVVRYILRCLYGTPLTIAQIGDEKSQDSLLTIYADTTDMAVISIGYRHAPEDPFPKGPEDCYDASMC